MGWNENDESASYKQAFISTTIVLVMTIWAISGRKLMKYGIRKALFISWLFGITGNGITYNISLTNFFVGKI